MEILKEGNMNKPHKPFLGKCGFCGCEFRCVWQECDYNVAFEQKKEQAYWTKKCPFCSKQVIMREEEK